MEKRKELLLGHYEKYPGMQIRDIFKFIYQSAFGCEHIVTSLEAVTEYIKKEYEKSVPQGDIDELDGDYCRVPLSCLNGGLKAETLGKIFFLSAKKEDGQKKLQGLIEAARCLVKEGKLPFELDAFDKATAKWAEDGYPAVHHSEEFRNVYKPAYRVIAKKYVPFLELLGEIDKRSGEARIAIEGGSASGKSTLAQMLQDIYGCTVLHMDDFFLRPEQRTVERFSEAGGNVDRERFLAEVLIPLSNGEDILYKPFDCHTMTVLEGEYIRPESITVIEGAYSMHPELFKYYDLSVFLDISKEKQRERILKRNGQSFAQRFFNEWIPMEERYFSAFNVMEKCDMIISIE